MSGRKLMDPPTYHTKTPHWAGLLWATDQPYAETWNLTTNKALRRRTSMPLDGFEPAGSEHPWTHALDRTATFNCLTAMVLYLIPSNQSLMNILRPKVIRANVITHTPKIAQYLVTMLYKRMVNLLHVSAFFGDLQGIMQQRKIR